MSENWNPNTEQDSVEQPLDFWAQLRAKEAAEKAQKEAIKKAEQESKAKSDREERLAKQLARSATKREEITKKADTIEDKIEASKIHVKEAEKVLKDESNKMPETELPKPIVIENFGAESKWEDDLTMGNTDVTLQFAHEVETTKDIILEAEAVTADARAEAARDTLNHISQAEVDTQNPGRIEKFSSVNDLGVDSDILRNQVRNAWEHNPVAPAVDASIVETSSVTTGDLSGEPTETSTTIYSPSAESNTSYPSESVDSYTAPISAQNSAAANTEYASNIPVVKGSLFRPAVAIAGGLFASSISGLRTAMSKGNKDIKREVSSLRTDIDALQAESKTPMQAMSQSPIQAPNYDAIVGSKQEFVVPAMPLAPAPTTESIQGFGGAVETRSTYPDVHNNQGSIIPEWIRQVEKDVKNGKVAELKGWQRDVLRIQHPDLLKKYEQVDRSTAEKVRVLSPELQSQVNTPDSIPRTITLAGELPAPAISTDRLSPHQVFNKMPVLVPNTPMSPYQYAMSSDGAAFSMGDYLTKILVFGAVFGAVLIVFFG